MLLRDTAKAEFNIEPVQNSEVEAVLNQCASMYRGSPNWVQKEDEICTINFAKSICSEVARLTTLAIGVKVDGSTRAEYLQNQIESLYFSLRHWVEYGAAFGTVILKHNGDTVECVTPEHFTITEIKGGKVWGCVFESQRTSGDGKTFWTRLEYHRFLENGLYAVSNRVYQSRSQRDKGQLVDIKQTPWASLEPETTIQGIDRPLFAVLRTPQANNIDTNSPYSLPVFSDAVQELMDLDIAYSRNAKEIKDSARTVLLDSDKLFAGGGNAGAMTPWAAQAKAENMKLPPYVRMVEGDGASSFYQEINPTLNTDARLGGINALLSQIGYKCGFSNGYFVFNARTGVATATQVQADQQRTIQLVKDFRDKLESCLDDLLYALDKLADLYNLAPAGAYEVTYDFGDVTYSEEEDKARWLSYVNMKLVPGWKYLEKFEGFTADEAKNLVADAQPKEPTLFGSEE